MCVYVVIWLNYLFMQARTHTDTHTHILYISNIKSVFKTMGVDYSCIKHRRNFCKSMGVLEIWLLLYIYIYIYIYISREFSSLPT